MNVKTRRTKSGLNLNLMSHISFPPFRSQKRDCCRYAATNHTSSTTTLLSFLVALALYISTIATATTALQKEKKRNSVEWSSVACCFG